MRLRDWMPLGLLLALLWGGCQSQYDTAETLDEAGQVLERYQRRRADGAKEGPYQAFYPDGTTKEEATYKNGQLEGARRTFHPNGQVRTEEQHRDGLYDGPFKEYGEDGTLVQAGQYTANAMTGDWTTYYASGELKEVVRFEDNEERGPFVEYHPNGQLKAKGSYHGGAYSEHGRLEIYDEAGTLVKIMQCDKGACRTVWTDDSGQPAPSE